MAGARYATWNGSGLDIHNDPDECWYDAEGRMFNPCDEAAPILAYEGDNATRTGGGYWWRFFHAPGLDDPVLMIYRGTSSFVYRELYLMTDGSGRQLAVGDSTGYIDIDDLQTTGRTEWRYGGQTSNAQGFGAERYQAPSIDGVSYFRNRAYDTRTGRWTQEDPIGAAGGINLYGYVGNNPVSYVDPFGLSPCSDLRQEIDAQAEKLKGYKERYRNHWDKGDGDSGHYIQIGNLERQYDNLMKKYRRMNCDQDDDHNNWNSPAPAIRALPVPAPQVQRTHGYRPKSMGNCSGLGVRVVAGVVAIALLLDDVSGLGAADDPAAAAAGAIALCAGS